MQTSEPSNSLFKFSTVVFVLPLIFSGSIFIFIQPSFALLLTVLFTVTLFSLLGIIKGKRLVWLSLLLIGFGSCASPYYWGATATNHGSRAQRQYIKNQRGHNPQKRFQSSHQPTFGAQDISRK